ncbi:MAG TPA: PAS domain-containing protein [Trichocoleus sp.]|jgi:PAS domain S-box-containing protein
MTDTEKTQEQLLDELARLRQQVCELEQREEQCRQQKQAVQQQLIQEQIARSQAEHSLQAVVSELNALQKKHYFVEKLTEISSELLYLFDAIEQHNVYLNARSLDLLGYSPEMVLAMGSDFIAQIMHPDDLVKMPAHFEQLTRSSDESFVELEYRMLHADGEWRWFSSRNTVFSRTADGNVHQILGAAQDITDRKTIEAELQESRSLFDSFMRHAPIAAYIKDEDGRYLYIKPLIEQLRRFDAGGLVGKTDFDFFPADVAEQLGANDRVVLANGRAVQVPETIEIDGEERYFMSFKFPFQAASGQQVLAGISIDITDLQQVQIALRESQLLYQTLAEAMPNHVWTLTADGELAYVNQRWRESFGITTEQVNQAGWQIFTHPDDLPRCFEDWEKMLAGDAIGQGEYRHRMADGSYRWFLSRAVMIKDEQGNLLQCIGTSTDIDDRKRMEDALRESQALYQTLAEALPSLVWTLTPNGTLDYANQRWREALGVTIKQVNQAGWDLIVHPDDLPCIREDWAQIRAGATVTEREYRHRMADGSYRWFLARMLVIRNEQGQLLQLVGASTDIDQRKRIEDALRSSEERLALASQAAKVGTFEWNIQTNEILWTAEEEALYGLPPGSFGGQFENWQQAVHPDDRDRAEQDVFAAVANRTDLNTEFRVIHPDGSLHWLTAKGRVFYDAENRPLRMVGMNEDISDRKQLEVEREQLLHQLEASLGQFEAVINSMSEGLVVSDAEGNVLLFNPAALVLHEYESVEQVKRHLHEFSDTFELRDLQGHFIPLEEWPLAAVLKGKTYRDYELQICHLNTDTRWIGSYSGTPVYDKQGQMLLAILTMHDITDRKQAEVERLQLLEQERKAREQAEAANRIKDEFLAVLSHELRTPLNPILGWAKLLRTRKLDSKAADRALETIERNAKLQAQLVEDLLDVSRILQGKVRLDACPISLVRPIEAALETVRLSAEAKGIQIQMRLGSEVGLVNGDANRLQQVVWNLLSNAIKFTPSGGRVEVRLEQIGSSAQIQVSDTGQGISPDFLPYVFEYFCQADSSATRQFGGLGLGLAIVGHLVELHGGTVKAESPGHGMGATFTVQLPLIMSAQSFKPFSLPEE